MMIRADKKGSEGGCKEWAKRSKRDKKDVKNKKGCKEEPYNLVGMTRFERATSRPPDVYSTD